MTNLDRWKPLAQNVMSELALGDDPQRLVVIATALAGAAQAVLNERSYTAKEWLLTEGNQYMVIGEFRVSKSGDVDFVDEMGESLEIPILLLERLLDAYKSGRLVTGLLERAALSDDGAPGKQSGGSNDS